ncbi:hypothetical protein FRB99_003232 [Tulasnella sp. 403]|nr:hypothetical protein FRB99_003232 [Tulasnella sp. 403]
MIREDTNEIGEGGSDPRIEGALSYRYYVQDKGPLTAVALEGDEEVRAAAARIFRALSQGLRDLNTFYGSLKPANPPLPIVSSRMFDRPVYEAVTLTRQRIVVKFVKQYNAEAHRILADEGLAPKLLYCGLEDLNGARYGGLAMVVMEFVDGDSFSPQLKTAVADDLKRAVEILHGKDLVFGDLREPNIVVDKEGKVKHFDFDWCAPDGKGRYTLDLNPHGGWAPDVEDGGVMRKSHDTVLLNKLLRC